MAVYAGNNSFTAAPYPHHGAPNLTEIGGRLTRCRRTRGDHEKSPGRRPKCGKTEIDSESCEVTVGILSTFLWLGQAPHTREAVGILSLTPPYTQYCV